MTPGFWYILILVLNLIGGIAIGWYACRAFRAENRRREQPSWSEAGVMLDEVRAEARRFNSDLKVLEQEIADARPASTLRKHLEDFKRRNGSFQIRLNDGVARLSQVASLGDEVFRQVLFELVRHAGDINRFEKSIEDELAGDLPDNTRAVLASAIGELLQSNHRLEQELAAACEVLEHHCRELSEAKREARVDPLTKIANRRGFDEQHAAMHSKLRRGVERYAVAVMDVDQFKRINDTHGHSAGDAVLKIVGHLLSKDTRPYDVAARLGGDEFALLLSGAGEREAMLVAERCRKTMETTTVRFGDVSIAFRASIGVAVGHADETPQAMLNRADAALYIAKQEGRNQTRSAESEHCGDAPDEAGDEQPPVPEEQPQRSAPALS